VAREILWIMKFLAIVFSSVLLVTGCSSSTTSQEQAVKLLEYEKCISAEEANFVALTQNRTREELQVYFDDIKKEGLLVESFLEACAKYRP
jgi:hypothetical protein